MQTHALVAIVTLAALICYIWMILRVGAARARTKIDAPAMTGHPDLERAVRVQANTLEWLVIFLPSLWLFAIYWNDLFAAAAGAVWILGRIIYALSYAADPKKRGLGFAIQAFTTFALLLGALGRAIWVAVTVGM